MELASGTTFGRYKIESRLSEGSVSVIYLATDPTLGRKVALKLLSPVLSDDPDFRSRFVARARAAAALDHPHVLPVYEAGDQNGQLFLASRHVPGPDLGALIAGDGALPLTRAVLLLAQVASALQAAHANGVVHGNVKPSNILIAPGEHAYLADFGLASAMDPSAGITEPVQALGSEYLAPELLMESTASPRSDIYALGAVLRACIRAKPAPYGQALSAVQPGNSVPALERVIARAMASAPETRYATANEFSNAVASASGLTATAIAPSGPAIAQHSSQGIGASKLAGGPRKIVALAVFLVVFGGATLAVVASGLNGRVLNSDVMAPSLPNGGAIESPPLRQSPSSAPTPSPITATPEELILPLSEFPFSDYMLSIDRATSQTGWVRQYVPTKGALSATYTTSLEIYPTTALAADSLRQWLSACPSLRRPSGAGDDGGVCVRRLTTTPATFYGSVYALRRNVSIVVTSTESPPSATESSAELALPNLTAIAAAQVERIDRVAQGVDRGVKQTPAPTVRLVTLRAEQIILPLADFPLAGYAVGADGTSYGWWYREFTNGRPGPTDRLFRLQTYPLPSVSTAEVVYEAWAKCDAPGYATARQLVITAGDKSVACVYTYAGAGSPTVVLTAIGRNVVVRVEGKPVGGADAQVEEMAIIARAQFTVIDRVAPP